jgi:hypothetical protein
MFWATRTVTTEMVRTAKSRNIPLPKKLNQSTGKVSNRQTGFNDASWGRSTRAYVRGIDVNLSSKNFDIIIRRAMAFARKSRHAEDNLKTETSAGASVVVCFILFYLLLHFLNYPSVSVISFSFIMSPIHLTRFIFFITSPAHMTPDIFTPFIIFLSFKEVVVVL